MRKPGKIQNLKYIFSENSADVFLEMVFISQKDEIILDKPRIFLISV